MIAPSAEMVEQARDRLDDIEYLRAHAEILRAQQAEIRAALPGLPSQVYDLIDVGIEAMRILVAGMPEAARAGISI